MAGLNLKLLLNYGLFFSIYCFNIDTKFPILFSGSADSYFGYNVALLRNRAGEQALIAAPKANSTKAGIQVRQPGALLSCKISFINRIQRCEEINLYRSANEPRRNRDGTWPYKGIKNDMFLGISLNVQQNTNNGHVVVCAHLWKNEVFYDNYLANGMCYVINSELDENSVQKLLPLINKSNQSVNGIYYYAFAQAGTSAAFTKDGKHLVLGAPGFYDWTGGVMSYATPNPGGLFNNPVLPNPPPSELKLSQESYIGYSVTTGNFFKNFQDSIAVGAPRGKNSYGQVYIIRALKLKTDRFSVIWKESGTQFGEYYGATVVGINLNSDKFTDLLVGAPFYSTDEGGDEGKVYVYISNGLGMPLFTELRGKSNPGARFGSCISDIGDINQDGFNDVAIGAPYEEKAGAVYIFHGSHAGIDTEYSQRITASEISPTISGFGISISQGLDIDNNYYPDILIGAYNSSNAVLLRTYPIITFTSRLEFNPNQIVINSSDCEYKGEKLTCVNVTACLQYTEKHSVWSLDVETIMRMDLGKLNAVAIPRGYLIEDEKHSSIIRRTMTLDIGRDSCHTYLAYIRPDAKDVITPIDFLFEYHLASDSRDKKFCKNCSVINPISPENITKSISFQTGCGNNNECFSNLIVRVSIVDNPTNEPLVIGRNTTLTFNIEVENVGEPAYLAELYIYLPKETPNINQDFCSVLTDQQQLETNASLQCDIGNPLRKEQVIKIQIKIDISKLPVDIQELPIMFKATTASTESEPTDNNINLPLTFISIADISITGSAEHEQIQFSASEEKPTTMTHTYFIMNLGPSPVDTIEIELFVPTAIQSGDGVIDFLSFTQLEADSRQQLTIPAECNDSTIAIPFKEPDVKKSKDGFFGEFFENNQTKEIQNSEENQNSTAIKEIQAATRSKKSIGDNTATKRQILTLDCKEAKCMMIKCTASPFTNSRKFAKISLSLQLKSSVFNENFEPYYRIEFISHGRIYIPGEHNIIQPENHQPDYTFIKTVLVRPGPPPSQEVERWIIFVSIGIGILLLIIILITLIKIGFFKRQQKEKMKQMLMQADLKEREPDLALNEEDENYEETKST